MALGTMSEEERLTSDADFKPNLVNSVCYLVEQVRHWQQRDPAVEGSSIVTLVMLMSISFRPVESDAYAFIFKADSTRCLHACGAVVFRNCCGFHSCTTCSSCCHSCRGTPTAPGRRQQCAFGSAAACQHTGSKDKAKCAASLPPAGPILSSTVMAAKPLNA